MQQAKGIAGSEDLGRKQNFWGLIRTSDYAFPSISIFKEHLNQETLLTSFECVSSSWGLTVIFPSPFALHLAIWAGNASVWLANIPTPLFYCFFEGLQNHSRGREHPGISQSLSQNALYYAWSPKLFTPLPFALLPCQSINQSLLGPSGCLVGFETPEVENHSNSQLLN